MDTVQVATYSINTVQVAMGETAAGTSGVFVLTAEGETPPL